jgi:hypothetical protein
MTDSQHDIVCGVSVAIAVGVAGWTFVRLPRNRFASGMLVFVAGEFALLGYSALSRNPGLASVCLIFGGLPALALAIFGIRFRKVTPKSMFIASQIGCWLLLAVPTLAVALLSALFILTRGRV